MSYFEELNKINVNDKTEKKNNLTYLSWAWAWAELKKRYPKSFYTIYENAEGWNYFTDGKTCWVKTGVTVVTDDCSLEHIEYLPVMDYKNKSIPSDCVTSFDVNKAIQRSLTKAVARHGLGLYIYAGEDLPDESDGTAQDRVDETKAKKESSKIKETKVNATAITALRAALSTANKSEEDMLNYLKLEKIEDMTNDQWNTMMKTLNKGK